MQASSGTKNNSFPNEPSCTTVTVSFNGVLSHLTGLRAYRRMCPKRLYTVCLENVVPVSPASLLSQESPFKHQGRVHKTPLVTYHWPTTKVCCSRFSASLVFYWCGTHNQTPWSVENVRRQTFRPTFGHFFPLTASGLETHALVDLQGVRFDGQTGFVYCQWVQALL
ncbi:hypothetical protein TNCV_4192531 [Trichonephila clavipes]|nr:hypothetical protein TNCV_4192531 [Trichonephila clavipes]